MKINIKAIGKGVIAFGTIVGGTILGLQARKGLKEEEFEPTLEPLGIDEEPEEVEVEETEEPPEEVEVESEEE